MRQELLEQFRRTIILTDFETFKQLTNQLVSSEDYRIIFSGLIIRKRRQLVEIVNRYGLETTEFFEHIETDINPLSEMCKYISKKYTPDEEFLENVLYIELFNKRMESYYNSNNHVNYKYCLNLEGIRERIKNKEDSKIGLVISLSLYLLLFYLFYGLFN